MLNSILRACIQQAVHAGPLYVTTTISVFCVNKSQEDSTAKKFFPAQSFEPSDPDLLRFVTARSSQDLAFFHCSTLLCGRHQQVNQAFQKQVCLGEFSIHLLDWHAPAKHQAFPSNLPTKYYPDPVMRNFSAQIGTGSYIFLDTNIFKDIKFETKTFSEEIFKLGNFP